MHYFIHCFWFLASFSTVPLAESTKTLKGFSIDLIHRDSPLSPFYNPSTTSSELIQNAALRSISRSNRVGLSLNDTKTLKTITIPDEDGEYLMRIYIGTPAVERYAIADTGSDLIWLQCFPCKKCMPQNTPLFDPRKSSTFRGVSCDSQPCTLLPKDQHHCGNSGECNYSYYYLDKSFTKGKIGVDVINFGSKVEDKGIKFPKFTFGCGYDNNATIVVNPTKPSSIEVVGLGAGPLSLVSQLGDEIGYKFSYCFVPLDSNSTSKLTFGNETMLNEKHVVSTPLIIKSSFPTFYYLNLEGIYVGKKMVKTSKNETNGNIVIDSGTTYTFLETNFYNNFETLVKEALGVEAEPNPPEGFNFCFRRSVDADFPSFVFRFTGAKIRVNPASQFTLINHNLFCMLVFPSSEYGMPLFGNQAQVGYQVEYDLEESKLSFAPADCTKL